MRRSQGLWSTLQFTLLTIVVSTIVEEQDLLQWLLPSVDHPVDRQIVGALERTGAELTDVVPLVWEKHTRYTGRHTNSL